MVTDTVKGVTLRYKREEAVAGLMCDNYLSFLKRLSEAGAPLNENQKSLLRDNDLLVEYSRPVVKDEEIKIPVKVIKRKEPVTKAMWMPKSIIYHEQNFVDWIDSINEGFKGKLKYDKYDLYCIQSDMWMAENGSLSKCITSQDRYEYVMREFDRIAGNSLYFANKYAYLQEASFVSGRRKYITTDDYEHQKIQCYLIDCGYSVIEGKPRQVGDTTIKGIVAVAKVLTRSNFFLKFITESKDKGVEIFDDKIKYPFSELPDWMRPNGLGGGSRPLNDTDRVLRFGKKIKSGGNKGINSKIEVSPPSKTAINGGSPSLVFIDEADSVRDLTAMITEGRPTLYRKDSDTGKLIQVRQLVIWSTGTSKNAGADFEQEWKRVMGLWKAGEYEVGIVPIFYDWTCRCDELEYENQKKYYYGSRSGEEGVDREVSIIQFAQHFPSCPEDMFVSSEKTLISRLTINENLKRINESELLKQMPIKHGYFLPVYKKGVKIGDEVRDRIVGSEFVPCEETSPLRTATIFQEPKQEYSWRYYQGTDPIANDTGLSKMASAIWDKLYCTCSAYINFRKANDITYIYQQVLLLGLYYDTRDNIKGVPEVFERNIGGAYKEYMTTEGYRNKLLYDAQLSEPFQSGNRTQLGLDNKGIRNQNIISRMQETFNTYSPKIFLRDVFQQLRTFVAKPTRAGNVTWGTLDPRVYNDDLLFAITFAKICSDSISKVPEKGGEDRQETKRKFKLKMDNNNNLYRDYVIEKVNK